MVFLPEARESARSTAWLMVRRSPAYYTRHIYICLRSDLVIAHLFLICPLRLCERAAKIMTALIRNVPSGWSCSVKAERKRAGESGGCEAGTGCPLLQACLDALANQISITSVAFLLHAHYQKLIGCSFYFLNRLTCLHSFHPSSFPMFPL